MERGAAAFAAATFYHIGEKLHRQRQMDRNTKAERERAHLLTEQFERCLVIHARAMELPHARGHDASQLLRS